MGIVVYAEDIHNGANTHLLVEHYLGYLERMRKILVDAAYEEIFYNRVKDKIIRPDIKFAFKSPTR